MGRTQRACAEYAHPQASVARSRQSAVYRARLLATRARTRSFCCTFLRAALWNGDRHRVRTLRLRPHQRGRFARASGRHVPGTRDSADTQVRTTWGPGATDVATILARHSANSMLDLARFVEANVLNWFIAAPDAHANAMGIGGERRGCCQYRSSLARGRPCGGSFASSTR